METRSSGGGSAGFDLFPFLGILACVLACLLLVVMSMVALAVGPMLPEEWLVKDAVVVEWDGMSVTIHPFVLDPEKTVVWPEKTMVSAGAALANQGRNGSPFGALLDRLEAEAQRRKARTGRGEKLQEFVVYVAVRPSGFANFGDLRDAVVGRNLNVGYEPLEQHRSIRVVTER